MLDFEESSKKLNNLRTKLEEIGNHFDILKLENELLKLESKTIMPEFWNDNKNSSIVLKQISNLKSRTEEYKKINRNLNDCIELIEMIKLEPDESLERELAISIKKLEKDIEKLEINTLLSGKYDINNAIITLHPRSRRN